MLYLLISPYQKCMSIALDKYLDMPSIKYDGEIVDKWKTHKERFNNL